MTPQEEQLLNALVARVNQTQLQEKDPDAEALLNRSLNPDALYILAQTVLVQNIALEQARAQVAQLQQQVQQTRQPAHATSFLGSLLGRREPESAPAQPQTQQYQPVPQYAPPPSQTYAPTPQYIPAEQPSFLRGAMQTATGVAAGALAFEGVESILHGFGHPAYGWGSPGLMGGGFERPVDETVINNYYDDPNARGGESRGLEQGGEQHVQDSSDQGGAQFHDASYDTSGEGNQLDTSDRDDASNFGDNAGNDDDSGFDDSGSFDDGGGFDSGGDDLV